MDSSLRDRNRIIFLKVEPKQTVYSITKKYKISEATLDSLNPGLKGNGLKTGQILNILIADSSPGNPLNKSGMTVFSKPGKRKLNLIPLALWEILKRQLIPKLI